MCSSTKYLNVRMSRKEWEWVDVSGEAAIAAGYVDNGGGVRGCAVPRSTGTLAYASHACTRAMWHKCYFTLGRGLRVVRGNEPAPSPYHWGDPSTPSGTPPASPCETRILLRLRDCGSRGGVAAVFANGVAIF